MLVENRPDENLLIGKIIEVDGNHVKVELDNQIDELTRTYGAEVYSIGQYGSVVKSYFGNRLLFHFVTRLRMRSDIVAEKGLSLAPSEDFRVLEADLFGEGYYEFQDSKYELKFERGVSIFPLPLQRVYLCTNLELRSIYECSTKNAVKIGSYISIGSLPCYANINEMFSKHTAILGSTGSGKSGTVAAILHAILDYKVNSFDDKWHPHIVILDPHNEYSSAFQHAKRLSTDEGNLTLPYWLMNFQEILDLLIGKSEFQATSQTNIIKTALIDLRKTGAKLIGIEDEDISIDAPIPFSLSMLIQKIEEDKNKISAASKQDRHISVLNKLDTLKRDSRLSFLMSEWSGDKDEIVDILGQFISSKHSVNIIDLSGIPNDVAGIVSSVIARLLFMYKLWETNMQREKDPILLVCEEAHKYVPNKGEAEFSSAQDAIRRIAKEGRKYGIGLLLVSQRPSELEATVLSQCNTWLVLRLTNGSDQEYISRFLPDSLSSMTRLLPSLKRREAIFVGQAATVPARILINELSENQLPRSADISFTSGWSNEFEEEIAIKVVERWRRQLRSEYEGASKPHERIEEMN